MEASRYRQLRREKTILNIMLDPRKEINKKKKKELKIRNAAIDAELSLVTEEDRYTLIDERRSIFGDHMECNQVIYALWLFLVLSVFVYLF